MSNRPIAVVTGASAGLGQEFARRLSKDHDLVLVARRADRLQALAKELGNAEAFAADLEDRASVARLEKRIAGEERLALLVNNAGFSGYERFVKLDPEVIDRLIEIHVRSTARLTRAALPGMVARKKGAVVNVASLLAFSGTVPAPPLPFRAMYGGAKAFLVAFTQLVANELAGTGVQAQVLTPGVIATDFHSEMPQADQARLAAMAMKPGDVVTASLAALAKGETICAPGLDEPALLDGIGAAQRAVLQGANRPALAGRYRG